ncbi:hypothetical protein KBZ21_47545, partial [Streptomyces sp. A73]|nr:hypothetical protein [Streptomyces sp. A73]
LDRESDVRNLRHVSRHSGRIATKPWSLTWLSTMDLDPTSINHYRKILRAQIWPHWGSTPLVEITTHQYKAWKNSL